MGILRTATETIDGEEYSLQVMGFELSTEVWTRLLSEIAKIKPESLPAVNWGDPLEAGYALLTSFRLDRLDYGVIKWLFDKLMPSCTVVSTPLDKDGNATGSPRPVRLNTIASIHFAGRAVHAIRWLKWALETNYSDFLDMLPRAPARRSVPAANGADPSRAPA